MRRSSRSYGSSSGSSPGLTVNIQSRAPSVIILRAKSLFTLRDAADGTGRVFFACFWNSRTYACVEVDGDYVGVMTGGEVRLLNDFWLDTEADSK